MRQRAADVHISPDPAREARVELARKIALLIGSSELLTTPIPGLFLYRRTAPTPPCPVTYQPSLAVIAQGRKRVELGRAAIIYDSSRYLLSTLDLPVTSRVIEATEAAPYLAMLLKFDMALIREFLGRHEISVTGGGSDSMALATGKTTVELLSACCRLLDLLASPQDIPVLGDLVIREILYRILCGPAGARLRAVATQGNESQRAAKAIAWLKENYAKPLRVEDLARIAGMGVSTFHRRFRALTAMSPLQYQKQIRLQAARQLMLIDGLDAASAAFEVGYQSASQFNREYRRFFGQPPIRDIRALRRPVQPLFKPESPKQG